MSGQATDPGAAGAADPGARADGIVERSSRCNHSAVSCRLVLVSPCNHSHLGPSVLPRATKAQRLRNQNPKADDRRAGGRRRSFYLLRSCKTIACQYYSRLIVWGAQHDSEVHPLERENTHSHFHTLTHPLNHSHSHAHTHTHTHSHTHTHTHTLTHTHTRTHTYPPT